MAPSAIVALCLLALASAAPQPIPYLQCATSCDPTIQENVWVVGKTYSFNYNAMSSFKLVGLDEGVTHDGITGKVDVSRINRCELAIKFTSIKSHDRLPPRLRHQDYTRKVTKYPLVVSINGDGQLGQVCAFPEDGSESINIKKGIASAIQFNLPSFAPIKKHIVSEKSVLGACPTAYSIENNGDNWVVNKEIVHSECQDDVDSHSVIPSILSKSPMPLQISKSVCTQVFSESKVPQTITCKDTKVVYAVYSAYNFTEATQESTLHFTSESTDMSVLNFIKGYLFLSKRLSYDQSMPANNPVVKLDAVLSNVCEMIQGQSHQDSASFVYKVIELMKHMPADAFVTVLNKIRAGGYCADYLKLEELYMNVIAFIGEPGALKVIAHEVSAGNATDSLISLYSAAILLVSKPTVEHVAALTPIAAMKNPSSIIMFAVAWAVNNHCFISVCENIPVVKNILNLLTDKLMNHCTSIGRDVAIGKDKTMAAILTLKTLEIIGACSKEPYKMYAECLRKIYHLKRDHSPV